MTREIKGINPKVFNQILDELPRCFEEGTIVKREDGYCACLNKSVILKLYDDFIVFDLGGVKTFINQCDFIEMVIA